jgi:hypothetical protein
MLPCGLGAVTMAGAASSIITARRPFAFAKRAGGFSPVDEYEIGCGGGFAGSANEAVGNSAAMSMTPSNVSMIEIRRLIILPLNHASWRDSIIVLSYVLHSTGHF